MDPFAHDPILRGLPLMQQRQVMRFVGEFFWSGFGLGVVISGAAFMLATFL